MTDLEKYIRAHAAQFDIREPADGHEERFFSRLQAAAPDAGTARRPDFFSRRFPRIAACAFAVCLAAFLLIRPGTPRQFRWVSNSPKAIYLAYMKGLADVYERIPWEQDRDWDAALRGMNEEGTPLFEQLPDELPPCKKGRILKNYYGELLAGAQQLIKKP